MNPLDLTASELLLWGIIAHLAADWPLQNDWMAGNKANLKHPAAWVHSGIHVLFLSLIFGWAAFALGLVHMLIDTRKPLQWWSRLMRQTKPGEHYLMLRADEGIPIYDMGTEVRIWTDQVFHILCIAAAALVIA